MPKEVIISTPAVNCYGFRILTEGIDVEQYRRNPVLLWMHARSSDPARPTLIGRMEDLRIDGDRLIGRPVFDTDNPVAADIARKWDEGFLRAASAGIRVIETSADPQLFLPGQTDVTVTRCRLEEVSIVDLPANPEALTLADPTTSEGNLLHLAAPILEPMGTAHHMSHPLTPQPMTQQLIQLLGLPAEASETDILGAVTALVEQSAEAVRLRQASIESLVDGAVQAGRISADARQHFISLGQIIGIESLSATLAPLAPMPARVSTLIHSDGELTSNAEKLSDLTSEEIVHLRATDRGRYTRLFEAEYGIRIDEAMIDE